VSGSTIIDDIASRRDLVTLIGWAQDGRSIPLARMQELANGVARPVDVERFGSVWLSALIDLAQRAGVGTLERREDGAIRFLPATEPPSAAEAWDRATRSWSRLEKADPRY
jgi:hypothetical protein